MEVINQSLQIAVRNYSKKEIASLIKGEQKTGKEIIRATTQKFIEKSIRRHVRALQKFISEEGKGFKIDFAG